MGKNCWHGYWPHLLCWAALGARGLRNSARRHKRAPLPVVDAGAIFTFRAP